ncbi:MAG: hypothetical protein JXA01_05380, partial [Dehalococcoidia bacterium]|nr:hypothetical protein [Dehalococcoidia bacterium]
MVDAAYEKLAGALNARGMLMPSVKCEEFYNLVSFLFTQEEAVIFTAIPIGLAHLHEIAENLNTSDLQKLEGQLETMADKGLIHIRERDGGKVYEALPFAPGIMEYQMMSGIPDERHMKIATLMRDYTRTLN